MYPWEICKYTRIPKEIEAIQWTGNNASTVLKFCGDRANIVHMTRPGDDRAKDWLIVSNLMGMTFVEINEFIVHEDGQFYPLDAWRFNEIFQKVQDSNPSETSQE